MELIFKTLQLANILAGALLLREAIPAFWGWLVRSDGEDVLIKKWLFCLGALAAGLIPIFTFWQRLFDPMVLWFNPGPAVPASALIASSLLFCVIFWFHHILCTTRKSWSVQHRLMVVVMGISIASTYLEMF